MNFKIVGFTILLICLSNFEASFSKSAFKNFKKFRNSLLVSDDEWVNLTVAGDTTQFFAIGDWGGLPVFPYRTLIESAVSKTMVNLANKYDTQFQLALGDNFYTTGVKDEYDTRFHNTFENVFSDKTLQTPWFVLMGNHDHYGNASAQIEYSKHSKRWILPDYNYSISIKTNNGAEDLIHIVMIDTVILCGNTESDFKHGQPKFASKAHAIASMLYFKELEDKIRQISNTSVPYFIVAGHFPVWSIAEHGPTKCLVDKLRPLLHQYQVSAYFCGHDHNLQHIEDTYLGATVEYFVSGSSNFNDNSTDHIADIPKDSLKFSHQAPSTDIINGGFTLFQVDKNSMVITFYETGGKELYQKIIYPRKINKN